MAIQKLIDTPNTVLGMELLRLSITGKKVIKSPTDASILSRVAVSTTTITSV
jgi:hypothetical protein